MIEKTVKRRERNKVLDTSNGREKDMDRMKVATIAKLVTDAYLNDGIIAFGTNYKVGQTRKEDRYESEAMMRENDFLNEFPDHESNDMYRWVYIYNTKFYCIKHEDEGEDNEAF